MYFPREIFPFSAVAVSLVDHAVAAIVLVGMMAYYGVAPSSALILLPTIVAVQVMLTAALALLLAMANLFYRDVKYLFEVVVTVWMFATPVVYPLDAIGGKLGLILRLNPMAPIVEAYRSVLLMRTAPGPEFALAAALSVLALLVAWRAFHRLEFQFAERI